MSSINKRYKFIIWAILVLFAVLLVRWFLREPPYKITTRIPGMDHRPKLPERKDSVIIGEFFDTLGHMDDVEAGDWPRFRGANFDNISTDSTSLSEKWDTSGPGITWRASLGEGYAGPAVHKGRVYLLDYNEKKKADMLRCFSLKTGTELWRRWYFVDLKRNHGYSRTIPAVNDKYIVTIGPRSHVMCLDPVSGRLLWTLDLEKVYGIPGKEKGRITPDFFTGQCPLIDNDIAVIAPGGKALMTGIDCATGRIVWKTPNSDTLRMSHGSIIPMIIHEKKMYVYNAVGGVCGVSAEANDRGTLMWKTTEWSPATTAASPVNLGNNEIAVFGSYGAGGARIRIEKNGSEYTAVVVEQHKGVNGIASDQQTPIISGEYIWDVMPENAGPLKKQLVCFHKSDLQKAVWSSGKENRYGRGLGPYIMSGNKLYLLDDDGTLYLFRIMNNSAELISSHKILNGIEAWGPMAIAGKFLIMRDARNLICLNISKNQ